MRKKTISQNRERNRQPAVVYYRQSTVDSDDNSLATQQQIVRQWAAETDVEIVDEIIDRRSIAETEEDRFTFNSMIEQQVTKQGDTLYVVRMDTRLWHRWRRSDMAIAYRRICESHSRRIIFVTTAKETASDLSWAIQIAAWVRCTCLEDRARRAAARRRAAKIPPPLDA